MILYKTNERYANIQQKMEFINLDERIFQNIYVNMNHFNREMLKERRR